MGKALKSVEEVEAEVAKQKAALKELKDASKAVQANRQKVRGLIRVDAWKGGVGVRDLDTHNHHTWMHPPTYAFIHLALALSLSPCNTTPMPTHTHTYNKRPRSPRWRPRTSGGRRSASRSGWPTCGAPPARR